MSWHHRPGPQTGQLLPLPDDGVAVSNHPPGWLGKRWRVLLDGVGKEVNDRVLRGRNYARRGRLRGLDISPGCAAADVWCEEVYRPSLRVRSFSRAEWAAIVRELTSDLNLIASLLEGELPADFVQRLEDSQIALLPTPDELSFDCSCGDYLMPCTHVATVFHVLTDALDGDPFLLLTLRGRDRDQLLATLRSDWGDEAPLTDAIDSAEEGPPDADWWASPVPVPDFGCQWGDEAVAGAGLRALGPPPGEHDLLSTLLPLYEAGHKHVREVIDAIPDRQPPRRKVWPVEVRADAVAAEVDDGAIADAVPEVPVLDTPPAAPTAARAPAPAASVAAVPPPDDGDSLTERIVNALASCDAATSHELASSLDLSVSAVRTELVDLLALGLVERDKTQGGVRWRLG